MPLLDHFHPPLSTQRHWESFHTTWAGAIADALNQKWLPEGYFAEEQLQPSARVEVPLYAVAYRPVRRNDVEWIDVWPAQLAVGKPLPELPLWLGPDLVVPVHLESTYGDACQRRRLVS